MENCADPNPSGLHVPAYAECCPSKDPGRGGRLEPAERLIRKIVIMPGNPKSRDIYRHEIAKILPDVSAGFSYNRGILSIICRFFFFSLQEFFYLT